MSAYAHRRYVAEYLAATDNEIATDLLFLEHAGKQPEIVGFIPRVPLWFNRFSGNPVLTRLMSQLAASAWFLLAGFPFHLLKALQFRTRLVQPKARTFAGVDEVGLALSRRATEVVVGPDIPAPSAWIVPPWVEVNAGREHDIPLLALVSAGDIALALRLALAATAAMGHEKQRRNWILQTYTAVPWFLTRIALSRVDANFVMAEHFDRWAALADLTTRAWRRNGRPERKLTLVQHGYMGNMEGQTAPFRPPYRLAAVSALYVYDDASDALLRSDILTPKAAQSAIGHRFTPRISLTPMATTEVFRVLFVGHPMCADLQLAVLGHLQGLAIHAFYKPHPLAGLPASCKDKHWTIVEERALFPVVDLVVSYRSTLVTEYEHHGVKAIVHRLTNETGESRNIANTISAYASSR